MIPAAFSRAWALALMIVCALPAVAQGPVAEAGSTLETVRARGHLICASSDPLAGFAQQGPDGRWSGFDVDFCRAVAAAVFGDANLVEFRALPGSSRFAHLQTGAVDLLARNASWTMRRDTSYGANYVATSFFDGQALMVPAALNIVSAYEIRDLSVCVLEDPDELANLRDFFFLNQAGYTEVLYESREDLAVAYRADLCQVVSAPASWLYAIRRGLPEPGAHRILPERISKEAFGPVVREGDDQWFQIVEWTLFSLINAEELGVSSVNIGSLAAARTIGIRRFLGLEGDFGPAIGLSPDFITDVISEVGNYGEIFERNFGQQTGAGMARGQNALWGLGGLLFAPPVQ
jgi:general L-amino acid transport system substrate-binding protein